jgi:ATP/maltotriose-dependent transcriptional regulator MalT
MNELLSYFLNNVDKPYFVINQENLLVGCNTAFENTFGIHRGLAIGSQLSEITKLHEMEFKTIMDLRISAETSIQVQRAELDRVDQDALPVFGIWKYESTEEVFLQTLRQKAILESKGDINLKQFKKIKEDIYPFTKRELDVLQLLAQGMSVKQVAKSLLISNHTVADHMKSIYIKLKVKNRVSAIMAAQKMGLFN